MTDFNEDYAHSDATEIFWEWTRANITTYEAVQQIKGAGFSIDGQELMEARAYNRSANAYRDGKVYLLKQPY